jgi:hypothetical protein
MISMGGKTSYVSVFHRENYSQLKSEGWDVSAAASLSFASLSGSASVDVDKHAADFHAFNRTRSDVLKVCIGAGGMCAPQSPDQNPSTWAKAVQDQPLPLRYELQDLPSLLTCDFFPDDPDIASRRQALTDFLIDHYWGQNQACKPKVPSKDGYWTAVANVSCAGYAGKLLAGPAAAGAESRVYLLGGEGDEGSTGAVCAWSQGSNAWSAVPDMPTARAHHTAVALADPFSSLGRLIVAVGGRQANGTDWMLSGTLKGQYINRVIFSVVWADGEHIVSGGSDRTIEVWSLATGACLRTLRGHSDSVQSVAVSPDGQYIVSASADQTIKVWSLASGACLRTLEGHTKMVQSVAVSADGQYIVSGIPDHTLKVWSLASGACLRTLGGHNDVVSSVAVSADGQHVVSASYDETIKVWSLASGACLRTLGGHSDWVQSVAVSVDGQYIVSGSSDHNIKVWSLATGACLRTLGGHAYKVSSVAVSADGQYIVSGGFDATTKVWSLPTGRAFARSRCSPGSLTPWRCRRTGSTSSSQATGIISRCGDTSMSSQCWARPRASTPPPRGGPP